MKRLVVVALAALAVVPTGNAKTIKVSWHEQKVLGDGALTFNVTKVVLTPTSWAVTATITNRTGARVEIDPTPKPQPAIVGLLADPHVYPGGMALVYLHSKPKKWYYDSDRTWWSFNMKASTPGMPKALADGASWTGTFRGSAKVARGIDYRVGFGLFSVSDPKVGESRFMWISDHSVRL